MRLSGIKPTQWDQNLDPGFLSHKQCYLKFFFFYIHKMFYIHKKSHEIKDTL